ncbi:MAG: NAD(+) synthase [Peptococcia bacterium]
MNNFGYLKVAVASPKLKVANPAYNLEQIVDLINKAEEEQAAIVVFPELSLTSYTCGDLFRQKLLQNEALQALDKLRQETVKGQALVLVGLPLAVMGQLYNCAVALQQGKILGVVPKKYLPNYQEFAEKRWFTSGLQLEDRTTTVELCGQQVPFGNLLFSSPQGEFKLGVEIGEDLWAPIPPSSYLALSGANIIANLAASSELVTKAAYRRETIAQQSSRCSCAYLYSSAGVMESTTDLVFSGDCLIYEYGRQLAAAERFRRDNQLVCAEIDLQILFAERQANTVYSDCADADLQQYRIQEIEVSFQELYNPEEGNFQREINPNPFVPVEPQALDQHCAEIFQIQVAGLAKRLEHTRSKHIVVGVSGGLDSTLALLVAAQTYDLLGLDRQDIIGVTMPGFGTTDQTYHNAVALMRALGVNVKEIDITKACLQHFADIGHDPAVHDLTYENVQARERTQVLMDLANKAGGIVLGTGDLSEMALGWSTYNGDHISMYNVNCSVPKTLVRHLVLWVADNLLKGEAGQILHNIVKTPISPELLPPDSKGEIQQKTEDLIGPYELHEFFLYYMSRYGLEPRKLLFMASKAYKDKYSEEDLHKWARLFYRRFFTNQFKRSCVPDGPKVGTVNLSPRGDWQMPSDADVSAWLDQLDMFNEE